MRVDWVLFTKAIQRFLEQEPAVRKVLTEDYKSMNLLLTLEEMEILQSVAAAMQPLELLTDHLSGDFTWKAVGTVQSQMVVGDKRVVAYYSKTFSPPQRNYCVTRRGLLAVTHFRPYLYGQKFRLRTDHTSLLWVSKWTEPSY